MESETHSFIIRVTASRLAKGLLAIPKKFSSFFPMNRCQIRVFFDDDDKEEKKAYVPGDEKIKECRIFGLSRWFSDRQVNPNDTITISIKGEFEKIYRIVLDRHMRLKKASSTREKLYSASTEEVASTELENLAKLTKRGRRKTALEEILQIARNSGFELRNRVIASAGDRHESVPSGLRVLLGELHQGKCQICSFTFSKKDGNPYFEIHHVDPKLGHQPNNLLLLCANCHAQFEHGEIKDPEFIEGWLVSVKINGIRLAIRQPVIQAPENEMTSYLCGILLAIQTGLIAGCRWPM